MEECVINSKHPCYSALYYSPQHLLPHYYVIIHHFKAIPQYSIRSGLLIIPLKLFTLIK